MGQFIILKNLGGGWWSFFRWGKSNFEQNFIGGRYISCETQGRVCIFTQVLISKQKLNVSVWYKTNAQWVYCGIWGNVHSRMSCTTRAVPSWYMTFSSVHYTNVQWVYVVFAKMYTQDFHVPRECSPGGM